MVKENIKKMKDFFLVQELRIKYTHTHTCTILSIPIVLH